MMNRAFGTALLTLLIATTPASAQLTESETAVYSVVESFFDALATRDSTLLASILLDDGQAHSVTPSNMNTDIRTTAHSQTLDAVNSWPEGMVERMWNPTILVNGPLAVVWGPYDFYINNNLSHCGVDAFVLIKTDDGWKISSIDYTVERGTCDLHPDGPPSQ